MFRCLHMSKMLFLRGVLCFYLIFISFGFISLLLFDCSPPRSHLYLSSSCSSMLMVFALIYKNSLFSRESLFPQYILHTDFLQQCSDICQPYFMLQQL